MWIIQENFRRFDKKDSFATEERCDSCTNLAEQYIILDGFRHCKGCLTKMIEMLDRNFLEHCDKAWEKRKSREEHDNEQSRKISG